MNIILKIVVGILCLFGIVLVAGVMSALIFGMDDGTVTTAPAGQDAGNMNTLPAENTPQPTTPKKTSSYSVGETVTDGKVKMTVNSVRQATRIDEQNNQFLVATADSGYRYLIMDVTIENTGSETVSYSPLLGFNMYDSSGYSYTPEFEAYTALSRSFEGNNIVPGSKRRGELPYMVPTDANGLQLQFQFEMFGSNVAVIDIA
jgi:hypothetical protein